MNNPSAIRKGSHGVAAKDLTRRADALVPTLIFFELPSPKIAALTLLDRLIVALHRGGAGPIAILAKDPLPPLTRTRALGISIQTVTAIPEIPGPVLLTAGNVLVQAGDVRRCLAMNGRLLSGDGNPLPFGIAPRADADINAALESAPACRPEGVARWVTDAAAARQAERELWGSLASNQDGLVDRRFNRPCGRPLSKLLVHTPVTPNMVSVASILVGLAGAFLFAGGTYASMLWGAVIFQLSAIIDCVDGELARILFKESPLGKWIDLAGDQIVHVAVFAGLALGAARTGGTEMIWLGVSAVIGALLSFAVVLRGMRRDAAQQGLLKRLIDSATNRDFSVLVLLLACLGQVEWFLWLAAVGSHIFWIAALSLQAPGKVQRRLAQ